jgi:hypothetical protein
MFKQLLKAIAFAFAVALWATVVTAATLAGALYFPT